MTPYTLECFYPAGTLTAKDNVLIARDEKGSERTIPFSSLQSIRIKHPTALTRGEIDLDILKSPTGSIGIGGGSVHVGNAAERYIYKKDQSEAAEQLYQYVLSAMSSPAQNDAQSSSFVDELVKLKTLLDQGALTQEEFDAAKKKLLGI